MSVTSISSKNKNLLWAVSAGRCEYIGCNKVLHTDILTNKKCNSAYIAHIVGDEPTGPRGDIKRSKLLANDINNLMLLCDTHHRMVDEDEITYTEPCLLEMKRQHEERIRRITDIAPNMSSEIILYGANIGINNSPLSYQSACEALLYDYYPASDNAVQGCVYIVQHTVYAAGFRSTSGSLAHFAVPNRGQHVQLGIKTARHAVHCDTGEKGVRTVGFLLVFLCVKANVECRFHNSLFKLQNYCNSLKMSSMQASQIATGLRQFRTICTPFPFLFVGGTS